MSREQLVEVEAGELRAAGAGEVQQAVDDLGGTEGLLGDLFEHGSEALVVAHVLGEHLRVAGDDGQRRVHFVRHAGGEQADGGQLFGLRELRFELDAVGDVVDEDDAAYGDEVARDQRGDGDVGDARVPSGSDEAELVEGVRALLFADAVEAVDKVRREDGGDAEVQGFATRRAVHTLHLRVPALDVAVQVDGEDADVDRLDDVFVELFQAFELGDLLLADGDRAGRFGWRCRCSRRAIRAAPCLRWRGSLHRRCDPGR